MTIVEQIKAEIERRIRSIENCPFIEAELGASEKRDGKLIAYKDLLSFISTLESEKPMNLDELMKEAQRYYSDNFEYLSSNQPTLSILTNIARHFAQWGAEHLKK